jgi:hypothetical protein
VSAGANVLAVQRMLGHASPAITLNVYADLFDEDLDAVADRLGELRAKAACCPSVARGWPWRRASRRSRKGTEAP